jgi:hypothetical protein
MRDSQLAKERVLIAIVFCEGPRMGASLNGDRSTGNSCGGGVARIQCPYANLMQLTLLKSIDSLIL